MKVPQKVLFISANYPPTICGVGDYTTNLAQELAPHGLKISVLTRQQGSRHSNIEIIDPIKNWSLLGLGAIKNAIQSAAPDIIHLQYEPFGFNHSLVIPALLSQIQIPVITTLHEVWHKNKFQLSRDKFVYRNSSALVVNDEGCLSRLFKINSSLVSRTKKIGVGPNIPTLRAQKLNLEINSNDTIHIGFFGFLNRVKKIDILLAAVSNLIYVHKKKLQLTLIGGFDPTFDSYHREILSQIHRLNLTHIVKIVGEKTAIEANAILSSCHIAALPFLDGATPRRGSFQACMALGIPTLTTLAAPPESQIIPDRTAVLIRDLNETDMTSGLLRLLEDEKLRFILSQGARDFAKHYTWAQIARSHIELYKQILNSEDLAEVS